MANPMQLHWFRLWLILFIQLSFNSFSKRSYSLANAWQQWNYDSSDDETSDTWKVLWEMEHGPGPRRGHSLVLYNNSAVILFGGRNKDTYRSHVPRTYDLVKVNGAWTFQSYDDKSLLPQYNATACTPVTTCFNLENSSTANNNTTTPYCTSSWDLQVSDDMTFDQITLKGEQCGFVSAASFYNDVWMYDLNCSRQDDLACTDGGWKILHPGSIAGCINQKGLNICTAPSERWNHGAALINHTTMVVYGGFSPACEDYCNDLWFFDFVQRQWTIQYHLDTADDTRHPGKRWKFSMVSGLDTSGYTIALVFGGHRLWHGFASDNSASNNWSLFDKIPRGGYLDDLWILHRNNTTGSWEWKQQTRSDNCSLVFNIDWIQMMPLNEYDCNLQWPLARASHAAAFDEQKGGMWVHGGYSTYYPYPSTTSAGSGLGVKTLLGSGIKPYSPFSFYLDDLWFYDLRTRLWIRMNTASSSKKPSRRMDHVLVMSRNLLILHGGYADNFFFGDTWYFYIQNQTWLQKHHFVHAKFPPDCIDDISVIERDDTCIQLDFPLPLIRANESNSLWQYQQILPFAYQPGYTPKANLPYYFGIVDNATALIEELKAQYLDRSVYDNMGKRIWVQSNVSDGTPIAPNAATGLRQYAREFMFNFTNNITVNVWEWCSSVKCEPTRDRPTDGLFGRSNSSIFIPQLRRLSPGWDGCRNLEWLYPPSRSEHRGLFVPQYQLLFIFGGLGYDTRYMDDTHPLMTPLNTTLKSMVLQDIWTLHMDHCTNNCSNQGTCLNGFCTCDVGFYGMDCSNITCPGSVCYYDKFHSQHCTHCCYDGYTHKMDGSDTYISDVRRIPCKQKFHDNRGIFSGSTNGICDGFGTCQCAPPFVGEDCSILDCKHNCTFNGYCSLEFPVSRCICSDGYFGDFCQYTSCLNNCSYPNGKCDYDTGLCLCMPVVVSPIDMTQPWSHWQGEDCSYLPLWSTAWKAPWFGTCTIALPLFILMLLQIH